MKTLWVAPLLLLLALTTTGARAQGAVSNADAFRTALTEVLSLATFGAVSVPDQAVTVTRTGTALEARLPLPALVGQADASVTAIGHPLANGMMDITALTFPDNGVIPTAPVDGAAGQMTFTIGQQKITGKVDPTLASPSSYVADFGKVRFETRRGDQRLQQTFDRYVVDGTFANAVDGRLTLTSQGHGTGFHITGRTADGPASTVAIEAVAGHFAIEGLDRARGAKVLASARSLSPATAAPEQPGQSAAGQRRALDTMADALQGLLKRFEIDEIMKGISFDVAAPAGAAASVAGAGTISQMGINMSGEAAGDRLDTALALHLDEPMLPSLPATAAQFMPHHIDLRTVLRSAKIEALQALLRTAAKQGADQAAFLAQAMALLADQRTHIGVERLAFDAGPLALTGSAKLGESAGGQITAEIHIGAKGVDALLRDVQGRPDLQSSLPMLLLAKGLGKPQGESLVWDITLGGGTMLINGIPFGQPGGKTR